MVTMEDRVTRLEAAQEFNAQQSAEVLSRLNQIVSIVEESRKEAREMNEAARREAREMAEAARKEAREANEIARREAREMVEAARRDARNLFIAGITIAVALNGGIIALILDRLPG